MSKNVKSIKVSDLGNLIEAVRKDYPKWDGDSKSLARIFKSGDVDPTEKYVQFYSTQDPMMIASYSWQTCPLRDIAG
jgi:hypothetical protein